MNPIEKLIEEYETKATKCEKVIDALFASPNRKFRAKIEYEFYCSVVQDLRFALLTCDITECKYPLGAKIDKEITL